MHVGRNLSNNYSSEEIFNLYKGITCDNNALVFLFSFFVREKNA